MGFLRSLLIIFIGLSLPGFLFSLGWGLSLIFQTAGTFWGLLCAAFLFTGFVAIGCLIDESRRQGPQ